MDAMDRAKQDMPDSAPANRPSASATSLLENQDPGSRTSASQNVDNQSRRDRSYQTDGRLTGGASNQARTCR